eukprot:CAMPEP_0197539878 /NCGR_PEP_ID=MMETSP1318-20131121/64077_1 /TAXON_ID=552666 /ORGANISM="Partenskyella glossopodia, Strain RCC365" /LENGTH=153 /DNA_ID=CAMNT_0043098711 /DNA_START=439 /DNA_END=900 /DNA_ORIENTATION=+
MRLLKCSPRLAITKFHVSSFNVRTKTSTNDFSPTDSSPSVTVAWPAGGSFSAVAASPSRSSASAFASLLDLEQDGALGPESDKPSLSSARLTTSLLRLELSLLFLAGSSSPMNPLLPLDVGLGTWEGDESSFESNPKSPPQTFAGGASPNFAS